MIEKTYECPECLEPLTMEELDQVCDCGCPSCRKYFDVEELLKNYEI